MNNLEQIVGGVPVGNMVVLVGGGRGGGKSYTLQNKKVMEDYPLTQPEKKATISPSKLLVKLIGRI